MANRQHSAPSTRASPRGAGAITNVAGIEVGHFTDARRPTGCTVVMARDGAVAGVDVRGAAPGTRETDLLSPVNLVDTVHAIMLAGGSAWGLEAATGAVQWLEQQGVGLDVHVARLPLVPAGNPPVLATRGTKTNRPDAALTRGHWAHGFSSTTACCSALRGGQKGRCSDVHGEVVLHSIGRYSA